jgi:pseudaminic acid cytidylyltransferase
MIAIIPARGGSKRIPGKNIKEFCGKPMISHAISNSLNSEVFRKVYVSTDDDVIADVSLQSGAEIARIRPKEISDDFTPVSSVIAEEIKFIKPEDEWVVLIYATSPLLKPRFLIDAAEEIKRLSDDIEFMISIGKYSGVFERILFKDDQDLLKMNEPKHNFSRTQDLTNIYFDAGQFVFGRRDSWSSHKSIWECSIKGFLLPSHITVDIDEPRDWEYASKIMENYKDDI